MQRNNNLIPGRDGEIQKLNLVECMGSSETITGMLRGNKSTFTVSTVETVADSSRVKVPRII